STASATSSSRRRPARWCGSSPVRASSCCCQEKAISWGAPATRCWPHPLLRRGRVPVSAPPAVVLLSGGLDSATVAVLAQRDGFDVYAMSFRYGQRHAVELEAAARVAVSVAAREHRVVDVDLRAFGGSALTDDIDVPKGGVDASSIPVTYVPARNTVFLSFALA